MGVFGHDSCCTHHLDAFAAAVANQLVGCGYYNVYTALMLTQDRNLRNLTSYNAPALLDEIADQRIRAELAVRSLIFHGIDNVDCSFVALATYNPQGIFSKLEFGTKKLIEQLKPRLGQS